MKNGEKLFELKVNFKNLRNFNKLNLIKINLFKLKVNTIDGTTISTSIAFQKDPKNLAKNNKQRKERPRENDQDSNNEKRASRNITIMVLFVSFLFCIGNIPNSIVFVFQQFVDNNGIFYRTFSVSANLFLFASQGCDIFVYYFFNKQYKKILKGFFYRE